MCGGPGVGQSYEEKALEREIGMRAAQFEEKTPYSELKLEYKQRQQQQQQGRLPGQLSGHSHRAG